MIASVTPSVASATPLTVSWSPVTESLDGAQLDVVAYQLIVVKDADGPPSAGFFLPTFSVHVPGDTTTVTVPAEFLAAGTAYRIEVLALEETGNQTISQVAIDTQ